MEGVKIIQQTVQNIIKVLDDSINDIFAEFIHKHYEGQTLSRGQIKNLFTIKIFSDSQQHHILHKNDLIAIIDLIPKLQEEHYTVSVKRFYN